MSGGASRRARAGSHQRGAAEPTLLTLRVIAHGRLCISREYWQGRLGGSCLFARGRCKSSDGRRSSRSRLLSTSVAMAITTSTRIHGVLSC
uniref:Uncharacterized protein n=1 Tax=Aegilops tauschii subsp. strangulata TaxID=200361 RepID=A0A453RH82_AEGTS